MTNEIRIVVSAENRVRPGVSAAKADLKDLTDVDATVTIHADSGEARGEIRATEDAVREIPDRKDVTIHVDGGPAVDEASRTAAEVDRKFAALDTREMRLKADITQVELAMRRLQQTRIIGPLTEDQTLKFDADMASLDARLADLRRKLGEVRETRGKIDLDTASANAKATETKRHADAAAKDRSFRINADTGGSVGRVTTLAAAVAALIPLAVAATGALAGIGAVGLVGVGATVAGFSGIGDAVTAMGQKATAGGGAVSNSASQVRSATRSLEQANRDLRDSYTAVTDAQHSAAAAHRAVTDAEESEEDAAYQLAQAQRGVAAAAQRVEDAQHAVAQAERGVAAAHDRVSDAERSYQRALQSEVQAQAQVTDARKAAGRALEDLQLQTEDMALSQEDAALAVQEAQVRLNEVMADPTATDLERQRAELSVRQAQQREKDLSASAKRLAADKADADAKGVEGSDQVVAAQQRVQDAQDRVADSARGIADAQLGVADAEYQVEAAHRGVADAQQGVEDAARRVEMAQRALADAHQGVADAQYEAQKADQAVAKAHEDVTLAAQRVKDAQLALVEANQKVGGSSAAVDKLDEAMSKLGPHAREFAVYLRGFIDGPLKELRQAGQEAFLPGIESGLKRLEPIMKELQPEFAEFGRIAGKALGDLIPIAGGLAGPLLNFATASMQGLQPLQGVLQDLADDLGATLDRMAQTGEAEAAMRAVVDVVGALTPLIPQLVEGGAQIMTALGPGLAAVLRETSQGLADAIPSMVSIAGAVSDLLSVIAPLAPELATAGAAFVIFKRLGGDLSPVLDIVRASYDRLTGSAREAGTAVDTAGRHAQTAQGRMSGLSGGLSAVGLALVASQTAAAAFGESAAIEVGTASKALTQYADTGKMASGVIKDLGSDFEALDDDEWYNKIGKGITSIGESLTGLGGVWDDSLQHREERIRSLDAALAQMVSAGNADQAAAAFKRMEQDARQQGVSVDRLREALPLYQSALDGTTRSVDNTNEAMKRLNRTQQETAADFMTTERADLRVEQSMASLSEAVKTNGKHWDDHTDKSRANRQALLDAISAANDNIDAMQRSGEPIATVTATFASQREEMIKLATQITGNRTKAQQLIDKLLETPKGIGVDAKVNTGPAMAALQALQDKLRALNGVLTVTPGTGGAGQGAYVYRSSGGWVGDGTTFGGGPKGKDTTLAWLDPDEFVVRADVAQRNRGFLESLNSGAATTVAASASRGSWLSSHMETINRSTARAAPVTAAAGGGTSRVLVQLEIASAGSSGLDELFMDWLRRNIRTRGGNVQLALGQEAG